ncbi:MAG: bifunctional glutamate N-acetyltransferase/amino-acid acetyltransferase ArgJ [Pseudomonadota bacterium]
MASFNTLGSPAPVAGIRLSAVSAGIKTPGRLDLVLLELAESSTVAATFTQNAFCAAPVTVAREHIERCAPRYLLVNTGNANAGTGRRGLEDARASCAALATQLNVAAAAVLPFSTGVIGEYLPLERLLAALPDAVSTLSDSAWTAAAEGILTTDTRPKLGSRRLQLDGVDITITGMAKGAGMIRPNMATMLAYLATDAAIEQSVLDSMWRSVVEQTFNRVTIDGDTSTNDAALLIATAAADNAPLSDPELEQFEAALFDLALELAQALVRDGEGASKFVTVKVSAAASEAEALDVAYTIAHSPLVKTALFASDPNWGRVLAAIGRAGLSDLEVGKIRLYLNNVLIACDAGRAPDYTEAAGAAAMAEPDIEIAVELGRGDDEATVWTSDLSYDYVKINAEYRT